MNLHQFRFVREAVRQNFNLTEAAKALFTSPAGRLQGDHRAGRRAGRRNLHAARQARALADRAGAHHSAVGGKNLQEVESLKRVGKDYAAQDQGNLVIAATHTQARYSLPAAIAEFKKRFPKVHLSILQGSPTPGRRNGASTIRPISPSPPRRSPTIRNWCRCPASSGTTSP